MAAIKAVSASDDMRCQSGASNDWPAPPTSENLGVTEGWRDVTIGEIAASSRNALVGGPFGWNLVSSDYVPTGVPVVRGQNMGDRWLSGDSPSSRWRRGISPATGPARSRPERSVGLDRQSRVFRPLAHRAVVEGQVVEAQLVQQEQVHGRGDAGSSVGDDSPVPGEPSLAEPGQRVGRWDEAPGRGIDQVRRRHVDRAGYASGPTVGRRAESLIGLWA